MSITATHASLVHVARELGSLGDAAKSLGVAGRAPRWAELVTGARTLNQVAARVEGLGASLGASQLDDVTLGAAHHARAATAELGRGLARPLDAAHPHLRNQLTQLLDPAYPVDVYHATASLEGMVKRFDPAALRAMSGSLSDAARTALWRAAVDADTGVAIASSGARHLAPDPGGLAHRPRI